MPKSKITAYLNGHPVSAEFPKDFKAERVLFTAETNGAVHLEIINVDARMNPDVISMTGEAYVKMRDADTRFTEKAVAAGGNILGSAAGAAVGKP